MSCNQPLGCCVPRLCTFVLWRGVPEGAVWPVPWPPVCLPDRDAEYSPNPDGTHSALVRSDCMEEVDSTLRHQIHRVLGRSPAVREVNACSCNGCEPETIALDNPVYDIERFGIHFVASPCHSRPVAGYRAVTRNRELALRKTYDASRELDPQLHTHAVAANLTFDGATSDGYLRPTGLLVGGLPQCVGSRG